MTIRLAEPGDLENYIRVRFDYFAAEGWTAADDLKADIRVQLTDYYKAHLNQDFYAAFAVADGAVVSAAFLTINEMPANIATPTGKYGVIRNVLTYPEHRRKGYSTKVLELLIQKAKDENLSCLQLSASEMGKPVYERLGFKPSVKPGFTDMMLPLLSAQPVVDRQ